MKLSELRELNVEELRKQEQELADELFRLRLRRATNQLPNGMKPRETRRALARVKTVIREHELKQEGSS